MCVVRFRTCHNGNGEDSTRGNTAAASERMEKVMRRGKFDEKNDICTRLLHDVGYACNSLICEWLRVDENAVYG